MTSFIPGSKVVIIVSTELCKIRIQIETSMFPKYLLFFFYILIFGTGNVNHKYTNIIYVFCFFLLVLLY